MAVLALVPGVSLGEVALGMTREQVRGRLGGTPTEFPDEHRRKADFFTQRQLQAYYSAAGSVERILVFTPNRVEFAGVQHVGRTRPQVLDAFAAAGFRAMDIVDFIFDPVAGLGVQLRDDKVWTAEVFTAGYHDNLVEIIRQQEGGRR
jgi:hypothetical protein